ncbi:MAG: UbiA family prenyltransferase, partial [Mycobacteriales bacterium]
IAAVGGDAQSPVVLLPALTVVAGFLAYSVALNDLADVAIDRINLAGRHDRALVTGVARRHHMIGVAVGGAVVALEAAAFVGWPACAVTAAGLAISAAYSMPPIGLSARGAVASLVLPACYVAVPFVVGALSAGSAISGTDLVLLLGLYVGFIGRILLKDFRDVRGDALFGKRTFLVRHGRVATCRFAAAGWLAGTVLTVLAVALRGDVSVSLFVSYGVALGAVLGLLRALSVDRGPRRDELIISTIAIIGRGSLLALLVVLSLVGQSQLVASGFVAVLSLVTAGQAHQMLRRGPVMRHGVPITWTYAGLAAAPRFRSTDPNWLSECTIRTSEAGGAAISGTAFVGVMSATSFSETPWTVNPSDISRGSPC